jgi:hypothetical protein
LESELRYRSGTRSAEQLHGEVDDFWDEYETDVTVREAVAAEGIDVASLDPLDRRRLISFREDGAGLDPLTVGIIVKFVLPVSSSVAIGLWQKVLLPRIERRWGGGAVGEHVE